MTTNPLDWVRPEIRATEAYHLDLSPSRVKLDQNELPFDPPRAVRQRVAKMLLDRSWARYPDFHSQELREDLGRHYGWPADGVVIGTGSGELLLIALETFCQPGQEVLRVAPSFSLYTALITRAHARDTPIPADDDLRLPLDKIRAAIAENPRRPLILCLPNNPTGDALAPDVVESLLETIEAPLLLDNAYHEFCEHDYLPLLERHRHLIVFRTFSKAWSMGGLRIGYLLANSDLVTELLKVKLPYNVPFVTSAAGRAVLEARAAAERRVRVVLGRRPQWAAMLEELGFHIYPSQANFLLARHPRAREIETGLDERGIRVRVLGGHSVLSECIRFGVGSGPQLRATRRALEEILK